MFTLAVATAVAGVMFAGAIFGFFYAWVCSTMWGLDLAPPEVAITAMQAMNASVRNIVFAPAFFGTPLVLAAAGTLALAVKCRSAGALFLSAAAVYLLGGMVLTMTVNVPMNRELAGVLVEAGSVEAARIWGDYSASWQFWNQVRTGFSGLALALSAFGLMQLGRRQSSRPA